MDGQNARPRFHEGQYLGAEDLAAIVTYLRTTQARHALGAHTWGIALGLQLTERPAPGAQDRVEVTLQPGFAWDGFGRPIVNPRPTRLDERLFAALPYHPQHDDPAIGGKGRLVEVWLAYDETPSGGPRPGFETCAADDPHARVGETFRFEIGPQPIVRQRSPVTIGNDGVDAVQALMRFDSAAFPLHDTSVPHQRFPFHGKPPRWLVPVGLVRWIARDQALGHFVRRDSAPEDGAAGRIRALRRYVGAVAEYIEAADGALVLHDRGRSRTAPHSFGALLQGSLDPASLLDDLVWVEGNLRVVGRAKLCRELAFRDADGLDEGTPFYVARRGDAPPVPRAGNRELWLVIGPADQADNRWIVGRETPPAQAGGEPGIAAHLVVVSSGDVGVGRADPEARLNVVGPRVRLQDSTGAPVKRVDLCTDGQGVGLESDTDAVTVRATGPAPRAVLLNPDVDGRVGIRVPAPQHDVEAQGSSIKLALEDGGGQLVLTHGAPDDVRIEARNAAGDRLAPELRFVADLTSVSKRFAVNVPAPAHDVDVNASRIKLGLEAHGGGQLVLACNRDDNRIWIEGFSADGAGHADEVLVTGRWGGSVPRFSVRADATQFTGSVGVGTATPEEKLHVAGASLRVDGPGGEQAVLGSEGHAAIMVGSRSAAVRFVDMRRLSAPFSMADADAWLEVFCRSLFEVSDERAKKDVRAIESALARVGRLRGVSYAFKDEPDDAPGQLGLIAQEVRDVVPEAVASHGRGSGIRYAAFVPLLIEAVKELNEEVRRLDARVRELSERPPAPRRQRKPKADA